MTSVVLPSALKNRLVTDVTKFLQPKTKDFYLRNGIPYRRSYLFYGTPGTGKTSMVQALAGHFGRNVCFLMPTHPEMTDDSLRAAVNSIPENSVVVFEDIDALFDKGRSNQIKKSSLTFSGLLNALDGIGHSNGQIFVLTTNLRENLDNALIRNGRVDLHFEFTYAIAEQMELMWSNFYPEAAARATEFSSAVIALLSAENLQVTTAALQHYFVTQMDSTVDEALSNVGLIVEEVRQNSSKSMLKDASVPAAKKDKYQNKKNKKDQAKSATEAVEEQPAAVSTEQQPQEQAGTKPAVSAAPESAAPPTEGDGAKGEEGKKKNKNKNKKNKALLKKEKKEVAESKVEVKTEAAAAAPVDGETEAKASATTTTNASAHVAEQSGVEDGDKMAPLNKRQKKNLAYQAKKAAFRKEKESTEAAEVVPAVEPEAKTN
jgi:chaperone BCS1